MSYFSHFHAQVGHMAVAQMKALSQGVPYRISRMNCSSVRYSVSPVLSGAGWNSAAVLVTPSRTPRFLMETVWAVAPARVLWRVSRVAVTS